MNADKKVNKQSEDEIQQAPAIPEDVSAVKKDQQKPPREKAGMDVAVGIAPRTPVAMNRRDIGGHHDQVQQVARASSGSATGTDVASGFVTPKTADQSPPKSDQISPVIPVVNYPSIHRRKKDGHYFLKVQYNSASCPTLPLKFKLSFNIPGYKVNQSVRRCFVGRVRSKARPSNNDRHFPWIPLHFHN